MYPCPLLDSEQCCCYSRNAAPSVPSAHIMKASHPRTDGRSSFTYSSLSSSFLPSLFRLPHAASAGMPLPPLALPAARRVHHQTTFRPSVRPFIPKRSIHYQQLRATCGRRKRCRRRRSHSNLMMGILPAGQNINSAATMSAKHLAAT